MPARVKLPDRPASGWAKAMARSASPFPATRTGCAPRCWNGWQRSRGLRGSRMYKLYWSPGSAAMAPHAMLEDIGASHELIRIDTSKGEQRGADYVKLN